MQESMIESNTKYLNINFNMPRTKWDGAEDPQSIISMILIEDIFEYVLKGANLPKPTAVFHFKSTENTWRQVSSGTHMIHHQ